MDAMANGLVGGPETKGFGSKEMLAIRWELEEKEVKRTDVSIRFTIGGVKRWSGSIKFIKDGFKEKE